MARQVRASLVPEIEEVVPLKWRKQGEIREAAGIASGVPRQRLAAPGAARQLDPLGEALEIEAIAAFLAQAEEKIDRTAEKMGEDVRPGGERRLPLEERDSGHAA